MAAVRSLAHGDDRERRHRFRLGLLAALLVHGLLYVGVREWSLRHDEDLVESDVIHLRLIDPPAQTPLPDVPNPPLAEKAPTVDPVQAADAAKPSTAVPLRTPLPPPVARVPANAVPDSAPEPEAALFDKDGRVVLPARADMDPSIFGSRKHTPEFAPDPMVHQSPLPYEPTRFDRYWKPDGETLLGEWVRKATKESTYDTKHGTRITCKAFLFLMACGWGPTPRVSIEELKAMRVDPPGPRADADEPYLPPIP